MTGLEIIGIWIAAGLTIAIYSFLYKDNPAYKLAEHIYVGVSAGYTICITYFNIIQPNLLDQIFDRENVITLLTLKNYIVYLWRPLSFTQGEYLLLIPALLGLLMYSRFFKKISWVSRIPIAFIIGAAAGIGVPNSIQASLIRHTSATIAPLVAKGSFEINSLVIVVGVVAVLIYFFFSIEQGKTLKAVSWMGIIFLMVSFGAAFGYTVMSRVSLVIGRMRFLILDWWPLVMRVFHSGT
ncbi:MAG: hypothetical protein ACE14V_14520 [bacterium]